MQGFIAYWRTPAGVEVDVVVGNVAVEAKSAKRIGNHDLKNLKVISEEGRFDKRIVVCREPRAAHVDGIDILPAREFVERLWNDEFADALSSAALMN